MNKSEMKVGEVYAVGRANKYALNHYPARLVSLDTWTSTSHGTRRYTGRKPYSAYRHGYVFLSPQNVSWTEKDKAADLLAAVDLASITDEDIVARIITRDVPGFGTVKLSLEFRTGAEVAELWTTHAVRKAEVAHASAVHEARMEAYRQQLAEQRRALIPLAQARGLDSLVRKLDPALRKDRVEITLDELAILLDS